MKRYLLIAKNITANNITYKIVEAKTKEEATEMMKIWCDNIIKKHSLVILKDKKIVEINDDMKVVKFIKDNGFKLSEAFKSNIKEWEISLEKLFGKEIMIIEHFYYGDTLDMASVTLKDGCYMQYNITEKCVRCEGHSCTHEQKEKFDSIEK